MSKSKKVLCAAVVTLVAYVGVQTFRFVNDLRTQNKRLHTELVGTTEKYKQLSAHAASLEISYVTQKTLNDALKKNFAAERDALTGRIKLLSNATFLIREKARTANQSDLVYQGEKLKYVLNEIRYQDGPPVGYVLIFDDGRVVSKLYNHQIDVKTAVSRDEKSGKYDVVSKADFILKSPSLNVNGEKNWVNKPFPLKIVSGEVLVDPTEPNQLSPRMQWWAPHLNANINLAGGKPAPGLGISLAGYGVTENDLTFRFLQIGAQYTERFGYEPTLTPIMWRPFSRALSNTYIGPGVMTRDGKIGYFLGVQVGL